MYTYLPFPATGIIVIYGFKSQTLYAIIVRCITDFTSLPILSTRSFYNYIYMLFTQCSGGGRIFKHFSSYTKYVLLLMITMYFIIDYRDGNISPWFNTNLTNMLVTRVFKKQILLHCFHAFTPACDYICLPFVFSDCF